MKVTLKKAFSLLDGRLSTKMDDIYEMLNFVFSDSLMTHQLPTAIRKLEDVNPIWFSEGVYIISQIKEENNTDDFTTLMQIIDEQYSEAVIELGKIEFSIGFLDGLVKS